MIDPTHYPFLHAALADNEPAKRDLQFLLDAMAARTPLNGQERERERDAEPAYCVEGEL